VRALDDALILERRAGAHKVMLVMAIRGVVHVDLGSGALRVVLSTEEPRFGGAGGHRVRGAEARLTGPGAMLVEPSIG
jgi:hypothetical protein